MAFFGLESENTDLEEIVAGSIPESIAGEIACAGKGAPALISVRNHPASLVMRRWLAILSIHSVFLLKNTRNLWISFRNKKDRKIT